MSNPQPTMLKVSFEHVSAIRYPQYYRNERPVVAPEDVPDEHWTLTERTGDGPGVWSQYNGLHRLIGEGELIRNPRVFETPVIEPTWRDVTPEQATCCPSCGSTAGPAVSHFVPGTTATCRAGNGGQG